MNSNPIRLNSSLNVNAITTSPSTQTWDSSAHEILPYIKPIAPELIQRIEKIHSPLIVAKNFNINGKTHSCFLHKISNDSLSVLQNPTDGAYQRIQIKLKDNKALIEQGTKSIAVRSGKIQHVCAIALFPMSHNGKTQTYSLVLQNPSHPEHTVSVGGDVEETDFTDKDLIKGCATAGVREFAEEILGMPESPVANLEKISNYITSRLEPISSLDILVRASNDLSSRDKQPSCHQVLNQVYVIIRPNQTISQNTLAQITNHDVPQNKGRLPYAAKPAALPGSLINTRIQQTRDLSISNSNGFDTKHYQTIYRLDLKNHKIDAV